MTPNQLRAHRPIASLPAIANASDMDESVIGKIGLLRVASSDPRRDAGELMVEVVILEVRGRFGGRDVLVEPVAGTGRRWVQLEKLEGLK